MAQEGGSSANEVRTWIAAHSSLAAAGDYRMNYSFYEAIRARVARLAVVMAPRR